MLSVIFILPKDVFTVFVVDMEIPAKMMSQRELVMLSKSRYGLLRHYWKAYDKLENFCKEACTQN